MKERANISFLPSALPTQFNEFALPRVKFRFVPPADRPSRHVANRHLPYLHLIGSHSKRCRPTVRFTQMQHHGTFSLHRSHVDHAKGYRAKCEKGAPRRCILLLTVAGLKYPGQERNPVFPCKARGKSGCRVRRRSDEITPLANLRSGLR